MTSQLYTHGNVCTTAFVQGSLSRPLSQLACSSSPFVSSRSVKRRTVSHHVRRRVLSPLEPRHPVRAMAESSETSSTSTEPTSKQISYEPDEINEVIIDENMSGFCSVDPSTGRPLELTLREKENLFLDAMQSFYKGQSMLSNDEFDSLKEELTWQGSEVVTLSRDEFRFLDAAKAYEQGSATMGDVEFDSLKKKLFEQGSIVAIQRGPRCSVERRVTFSDVIQDKKRTFALFVPAGLFAALTWLSLAFEFTPLHRVDPVVSLVIGSPIIFLISKFVTGLVVPEGQVMVGDCPSCGRRTHVLFGNVLNQKGFSNEADVKCGKCKATLKVEKGSGRMILMKQ